jgi:small-conductance mechanosensitive channel
MEKVNAIFDNAIFQLGEYSLTIGVLFKVILIILFTFLFLRIIRKILWRKKNIGVYKEGTLSSFFQIVKYLVWIFSILLVFDTFGLKISALLTGSAALLVGIGLGLQKTFNDFVSGIVLLFEGSVKVGDVLDVDGGVVKIKNIGLRTSEAINRDDISIIIPNSLITNYKVVNWSHNTINSRFRITVGVDYSSDIALVEEVLIESALEHPSVNDNTKVSVFFTEFGNSSLNFELLFFSEEIFRIERVKSDIRKIINKKFRENHITIPFPQMDLHFKNNLPK